jgi:hypothetical protein
MPAPPAHLGPGLLFKGLAPRSVSLTAFAVVQVVIDLESVYAWARGHGAHPVLHTFIGGTACGLLVAALVAWAGRGWARAPRWLAGVESEWMPALWGGVVGGVVHVFLDALVRDRRHPFAPFAFGDPFQGWITLDLLDLVCYALGALGLLLLLAHRRRRARTLRSGFTPASSPGA